MKKIIFLALLLPTMAFASATIDSLTVSGNTVSASGSATYQNTQNTLQIMIDQVSALQATLASLWSVTATAKPGDHTLTATVSNSDGSNAASVSKGFTVASTDPGQPICMRTGECPYFGILGGVSSDTTLKSGEGDCPLWFSFGCTK